jgi:hypothetical protein
MPRCSIMRWLFVRQRIRALDGFGKKRLKTVHTRGQRFNRALLLVQNVAQIFHEALQEGVSRFEFRQSIVGHTGSLAERACPT